jgi:hypothetical protein
VVLTNELKVGGVIEITFPTQYPEGLGITALNPLKCSTNCTISGRAVTLTYSTDLVPGAPGFDIKIDNVLNPTESGGTGNFWVKAIKGGQVIDENLIFGVIGVAGDIGVIKTASVGLDSEGVQFAGELSKYVFTFTTSRDIPDNNFVRIYLPGTDFEVAKFPSCSASPVGGKVVRGRLICESFDSKYIDVSGFKDQFVAGTTVTII